MKGKWELVSALLYIVFGLTTLSFPLRNDLVTVIWFGNGVLQLSLFALANGWKKLSLGLFTGALLVSSWLCLSLADWSGFAISIWCLVFPVVLLSYWHRYKNQA